jgi:peptidyl-prolyl cis-trans isomerase B (cyclophilin B)
MRRILNRVSLGLRDGGDLPDVALRRRGRPGGQRKCGRHRCPRGVVWRFLPRTPGHVAYVKHLIATGFYDGTTLHRVIPQFVVQGGDPNTKNDDRSDDGEGEADRRLKAEFSRRLHYRPGTVGMARDADPDSGSCQFFVALENLPRLDGRYTILRKWSTASGGATDRVPAARSQRQPAVQVTVRVRLESARCPSGSPRSIRGRAARARGPHRPRQAAPFDPATASGPRRCS